MTRSNPTTRWIVSTLGASVLALFSSGCVTHHHYTSGYPVHRVQLPPPTPADGYHYAFDGVTLVFDGSWGGYRVRGHADHYFHLDFYYRFHNDAWERCARLGGPWVRIDGDALPVGLRARHTRRDERQDARQERREDRRNARHERRDEVKEQRAERRDETKERREVRREVRHERREDAKEQGVERREVRTGRRDQAKEQRVERRVVQKEQRDEPRVVEQKQREQQAEAKQAKQKKHGKDDAKDGVPANQAD